MLKRFYFNFIFSLSLILSSLNINQSFAANTETLESMHFYQINAKHTNNGNDQKKLVLTTSVVDEANLLSEYELQQLDQRLRSINKRGIAQPAIIIIPTTGDIDTFDYALDIAERWKLGDKDIDNGLLILVAIEDKKIFILTGYGIEASLPDSVVGRIIRHDIKPYFKNGEFFAGLSAGLDTIEQKLNNQNTINSSNTSLNNQKSSHDIDFKDKENNSGFIMIFFMFLLFGNIATGILGKIIGSTALTAIFFKIALSFGASIIIAIPLSIFLWFYLMTRSSKNKISTVILPSGNSYNNYDLDSSYDFNSHDSFDSYSGGGGDFGGGGAGGSWQNE